MNLMQKGDACINIPIFDFSLKNVNMLFTLVAQSP